MLGLRKLIIANYSSNQWKITMQDKHPCWLPTFSLAQQWPLHFLILELNCHCRPEPFGFG